MKAHVNKAFEKELIILEENVLLLSDRVQKIINNSIKALEENNTQLALSNIEYDKYIDEAEILIDEQCVKMLAKWQPLGQDLRLIVSILKMVTYFERLGDMAVNISERVLKLKKPINEDDIKNLKTMALMVKGMIKTTMEAFFHKDIKKAQKVIKDDDIMDELYHNTIKQYIEHKGEYLFHLLSIAKWLERMADHCTNLAELIIYMVNGEDIRHKAINN